MRLPEPTSVSENLSIDLSTNCHILLQHQLLEMPITPQTPPLTMTERASEKLEDIPSPPENEYSRNSAMDAATSSANFGDSEKGLENNKKLKMVNNRATNMEYPFVFDNWDVVPALLKIRRFRTAIDLPQATILSRKLADAVIMHAKQYNIINESELACVNCQLFPELPVTGACGHTRCTNCIKENEACPCGVLSPDTLHVNTLVRDLVEKFLQKIARPPFNMRLMKRTQILQESPGHSKKLLWRVRSRHENCPYSRPLMAAPEKLEYVPAEPRLIPMSFQTYFNTARELVSSKLYYEAAPLLAHVAASSEPIAKDARALLDRVIAALTITGLQQRLTRQLFQMVQQYSMKTWVQVADLECTLCCSPLRKPVTTPCGHNFCHTCLEKSLDYWKICPLCKSSLVDFNIFTANETVVITAALRSINAVPPPVQLESNEIRILVCTSAFPGVGCPVFLLQPRCCVLVRRLLNSDRRFGMLGHQNNDGSPCTVGTIMEIRDCVYFEDGRSIITTIGVSRFRVLEKDHKDGCDVARIEPFTDTYRDWKEETVMRHDYTLEVSMKATDWLESLDSKVLDQIENTFGKKPDFSSWNPNTWKADGPMWLWWIISILPLQEEIKMMLLTSEDLVKRLLTVACTFDSIKREKYHHDISVLTDVIDEEDIDWLNG